jgi:hypothetical protein
VYAPPLYSRTTSLNMHSLHSMPSSCCVTPKKRPRAKSLCCKGGTTGIAYGKPAPAGGVLDSCAHVDVWLPENTNNVVRAPTMNDPNASVTLDITPPSESPRGDCAIWVYHYGNSPSKESNSKLQPMLIASPEEQRFP